MGRCGQTRFIMLVPLLLATALFSLQVYGERAARDPDSKVVKLPNYAETLEDDGFESIKFSKRFKLKGWRIGDDLYIGGVKAAGDYGPGFVLDKGRYSWGVNHQGIEFQFRF